MSQSEYFEAKGVNFAFRKKNILKHIDFSSKKNQMVGLIGPNGSGKTTLLKCLSGYFKPFSGSINIEGQSIQHLSSKDRATKIAVVQQDLPEIIPLKVKDILYIGKQVNAPLSTQLDDSDITMLRSIGIEKLQEHDFHRLSGGQRQRVMIARALLQNAEIILLDEPTNHLDISCQHRILQYLKEKDITVICSLHDLNLASEYCDELALLYKGSLLTQGGVEDVLVPRLIEKIYNINVHQEKHPLTQKSRLLFSC